MAINLNLEKFGAQFSAFVDFAKENAANGDTLACIGGDGLLDPEGKPRTIVAKTDDDRIKRFGICMQDGVTRCLSAGPTAEAPLKLGQPMRKASDPPLTFSFGAAKLGQFRFGEGVKINVSCKTV